MGSPPWLKDVLTYLHLLQLDLLLYRMRRPNERLGYLFCIRSGLRFDYGTGVDMHWPCTGCNSRCVLAGTALAGSFFTCAMAPLGR